MKLSFAMPRKMRVTISTSNLCSHLDFIIFFTLPYLCFKCTLDVLSFSKYLIVTIATYPLDREKNFLSDMKDT